MTFDKQFIPLVLNGSKYLTIRKKPYEDDFFIGDIEFHSNVVDCCTSFYFMEIELSYIQNFRSYGFLNLLDMKRYFQNYISNNHLHCNDMLYFHLITRKQNAK
jgi:hypothetical protein